MNKIKQHIDIQIYIYNMNKILYELIVGSHNLVEVETVESS
jgi:hypothetical protein